MFAYRVVALGQTPELVLAVDIGLGRREDLAVLVEQVDRDAREPIIIWIVEVAIAAGVGVHAAADRRGGLLAEIVVNPVGAEWERDTGDDAVGLANIKRVAADGADAFAPIKVFL